MRSLALMTALGFSSGLPFALSAFTLRMWLSTAHIPLQVIGLTASIGLPYTLKFLWAPVFDEVRPLFWGRRRGWLILVQAGLVAAIAGLGVTQPEAGVRWTLVMAGLVAFMSASQDTLIDAWRIETFAPRQMGTALAGYVWGYRAALLLSGAGVIALSVRTGWHFAILLMAGLAVVGPVATVLASEPAVAAAEKLGVGARFLLSVWLPLREFLARRGAVAVILFILLFRLGEATAGVMLAPYYTYLGFNRVAIAVANGPVSLAATLAGAAAGGALVARIGVGRTLIVSMSFQTLALAMYPALGLLPGVPHILVATSVLESFAETFEYAAFLTYLSGLCDPRFTATQYALLSSISPIALHTIGGVSGYLAQAMGFIPFFVMTIFAALPAMGMLLVILRFYPPKEAK